MAGTWSVMTLNLRVNSWLDGRNAWRFRVRRITTMWMAQRPLVVGTQEGRPAMLAELKARLPQYVYTGTGRETDGRGEHCALFYDEERVLLEEQGQFWLSSTPGTPSTEAGTRYPRICTWGVFRHRAALGDAAFTRFRVYNTHLDHQSARARQNGLRLICRQIRDHQQSQPLPVILLGDFNMTLDDRGFSVISDAGCLLKSVYQTGVVGRTYHAFRGGQSGRPIDYILTSPEFYTVRAVIDECKYAGGYPSDHYPVLAELTSVASGTANSNPNPNSKR